MAKNKKKETKKQVLNFNNTLRSLTLFLIKRQVYETNKRLNDNEIFELTSLLKDWYLEIKGEFVLKYIDYISFCELINYVNDIYTIARNTDFNEFDKSFKVIRNKLIDNLSSKNVKLEYFLAVNRLCSVFDNISSRPHIQKFDKIEGLTFSIFLMSLNISTYLCKMENKKISAFIEKDDNTVIAKYYSNKILTDDELKNINHCCLTSNPNKTFFKSHSKIFLNINDAYEKFMEKDLDNDFKASQHTVIRFGADYTESPFFREGKYLIPEEEILKIPNDRKYLSPEGGIKFEILNKDLNIDSIEMMEYNDKFLFNLFVINTGGIYISEDRSVLGEATVDVLKERSNEKQYTDDLLKISFYISKEVFESSWDFKKILYEKKAISCNLLATVRQSESFTYTLLCCIYLAYYDPFKFKGKIRMYNLTKNKKGGYTRSEGFRIAHLRKLPTGYKASNEAKIEAIKAGFNNIPEGYTFVSASYGKDNESDKKKKTIIVK